MSTYISPTKSATYSDASPILKEFLYYASSVRSLSPRTVNGYYIDMRTFFKFVKLYRLNLEYDVFDTIEILDIDLEFISKINKQEIYEFIYFINNEKHNSPSTRARKLCSIKAFFVYCVTKKNYFKNNPALDIDSPKIKKSLPKYLSLEECIELLKNISTDFTERDFCIITLFLNCGMRLSELVSINTNDFKESTLRIVGKGNKERTVYLTAACKTAINTYLAKRNEIELISTEKALFISKRTKKRLTPRRVEQIVEKCLLQAGLNDQGYSPHKLRHTAATLMYRSGGADVLALQEILGHANVGTTQIYTHISNEQVEKAVNSSPLANLSIKPVQAKLNKPENKTENDASSIDTASPIEE